MSSTHVILYHDPTLADNLVLADYLLFCNQTLDRLAHQFGFSLRHLPIIVLVGESDVVSKIVNNPQAGAALANVDMIIVSRDCQSITLEEMTIHELAHLFIACWKCFPFHFNDEGLATWLEGTYANKPIDFQALAIVSASSLSLVSLLERKFFFGPHQQECYMLAGSFTGHVIRRFGWEQYRRFFRRAGRRNFQAVFRKVFGVALQVAERQWRDELLSRREEFEPEISQAVLERQIEDLFWNEQHDKCVELGNTLRCPHQVSGMTCCLIASSHVFLGQYYEAIALLEPLLERRITDPLYNNKLWRQFTWLYLGNIYDLVGQRDKAVNAYHQSLSNVGITARSKTLQTYADQYLQAAFRIDDMGKVSSEVLEKT